MTGKSTSARDTRGCWGNSCFDIVEMIGTSKTKGPTLDAKSASGLSDKRRDATNLLRFLIPL